MLVLCMLAFKPCFSPIMVVCLRGNVCRFSLRGVVLSKLCVLSRFTGVCLFPQLCGCRVCVSRFFCVFQAVPSPLLSPWQCQYQTAPRASMPQRRQSESLTPDLWPHSFGKMFSFLSATLSLSLLFPSLFFQKLSPYRSMNIYTVYTKYSNMRQWVRAV